MCKEKTQFVLKKFCRHLSVSLLNLFLALEAFKRTCITRFTEKYINVQLSLSSRGLHVSGRKSILTSATEAYDHTESYRLLGFCLTITFLFKSSTPDRFPLKLPCLLKDLLVLFVWICYKWQILVVSKTGNPSISMAISIGNGLVCWI